MLKRITKITGLLVCAASIISIVPAMAADVKSYDAQEGTIYNAKAKGAGIYIDGEINDKDEDVYFMTPDGKYNSLDGVDDGIGLDDILLGQYMVLDDGDTVVDIKDNYKVIDENTREDLNDDLDSTARKVIKNDNDGDRFEDDQFDSLKSADQYFVVGGTGLSVYSYALEDTDEGIDKDTEAVYVDYEGNYVDADYNLGNLKVTTTGGSIIFKNTDDTYDVKEDGKTYEYKAVINHVKNVTDIGDYLYRWADLSIYRRDKDTKGAYENVTDQVGFGSNKYKGFADEASEGYIRVFEKLSKPSDSDDTVDGIKYAKDATIYFVADEDGKSEVVLGNEYTKKDGATTKITGNDTAFCSAYYDPNDGKVYAETMKLKSKEGFNYLDLGDTDSTDSDTGIANTGGLVYTLDGGYVKAWDGDESFEKVYKVDGDMDNLSIGSKDLMILWNEDDELYTIINNTANTSTTDSTGEATATDTTTTTTAAAGWVNAADGTWSYNKADGTKATGWLEDGSAWYHLNASGIMQTGWINDNGTWYYLSTSGAMKTGWINDNGTWYYCDASGAMLSNTIVDGYLLGADGAWIQ